MVLREPLTIFIAVHKALFLRELAMKLTTHRLSFFWAFFEPFFQVFILVIIKFVVFGRGSDNFDFAVFLVSAFIGFNMFKHILSDSMGAFQANKPLFVYRQVKPIDTILARVSIEVFFTTVVMFIFIAIGFYFHFDMNIENIPLLIFAYIWLLVFSISLGILFAVVTFFSPSLKKIIGFIMMPLMFVSAIFYTVESLPSDVRVYFLYNPLIHFMEMIHGNYFYVLDTNYVDYNYMLLWTIIPLFMGLWLYTKLERKIITK